MMATPTNPVPWRRREALVVAALTLIGLGIRGAGFSRMGLTHFDEGVYAASGIWSLTPDGLRGIDPEVIPYSPPGFPILVGLAYLVFGLSDVAPLIVALVCGVATIPVVAWVGRRTFGPGAGAAGAALTALAMAHVAFSRKALTDAPLLLLWIAALGLGARFLERPGLARAIALGVVVGLAQNMKYNGALTGVAVGLTAIVAVPLDRDARTRSSLVRTFGWGGVAALIAGLMYLPWYRFVESHGGYASLLRHHGSYVGPSSSWLPHLRQQLAQVTALSGGPGWNAGTWAVAWLAASIASCGTRLVATGSRLDWTRLRIGGLFGAAVMAGIPDVGWWIGAAWSGWLVVDRRPAMRLLGVAWILLSVLTPFYHPYARLWLPLHGFGGLLLAGVVTICGPFQPGAGLPLLRWSELRRNRSLLARCLVAVSCMVLARRPWSDDRPEPFRLNEFYRSTDELRIICHDIVTASTLPVKQGASLRVLARRPIAFYLALEGAVPLQLAGDADGIRSGPLSPNDWALVDDAVVPVQDVLVSPPSARPLRYAPGQEFGNLLDPVTRLDIAPGTAFEGTQRVRLMIRLLRPVPSGGPPRAPGRGPIRPTTPSPPAPTDLSR